MSKIEREIIDNISRQSDIERCLTSVKTAAHKIKMTQGSSIYGAVDCAYFIMESMLKDSKVIKPLSVLLPNKLCIEYDTKPLFISVLAKITKEGVFPFDNFRLSSDEYLAFKSSISVISKYL